MRPIGTGVVECHNARTATDVIAARTSPGARSICYEMGFHVCMAHEVAVVPLAVLYTNPSDSADGGNRLELSARKDFRKRDLMLTVLWLLKYVGDVENHDGTVILWNI
jgi:hypothetical protein